MFSKERKGNNFFLVNFHRQQKALPTPVYVVFVQGSCFLLQGFWKSRLTNTTMRQRRRRNGSITHVSIYVSTQIIAVSRLRTGRTRGWKLLRILILFCLSFIYWQKGLFLRKDVNMTIHLLLIPKFRICGAIPPFLHFSFVSLCLMKHRENCILQ
jgi:hypothetical protein